MKCEIKKVAMYRLDKCNKQNCTSRTVPKISVFNQGATLTISMHIFKYLFGETT
uniref:Uncharacterized protein n=1 Tax=Arion vulgaris TaxID=1028688 RepID=A0A0B7A6Q8_9EUPU